MTRETYVRFWVGFREWPTSCDARDPNSVVKFFHTHTNAHTRAFIVCAAKFSNNAILMRGMFCLVLGRFGRARFLRLRRHVHNSRWAPTKAKVRRFLFSLSIFFNWPTPTPPENGTLTCGKADFRPLHHLSIVPTPNQTARKRCGSLFADLGLPIPVSVVLGADILLSVPDAHAARARCSVSMCSRF